jgi:hypothetical protein
LQRGRNLRQSKRRIAFCEQIQYGKCAVEGLNLIRALRGSVSQYESPFRTLITKLVSQDMRGHVKCRYVSSPYGTPLLV